MEKSLIASLLRVYHSDQPRQSASGVLSGLVIAHKRAFGPRFNADGGGARPGNADGSAS